LHLPWLAADFEGVSVKDIHEILRQKELDCVRVQAEIEALRLVIPLLEDEASPEAEARKQPESAAENPSEEAAVGTGTEGPSFSSLGQKESFWKRRR
jgi:hypothetical protein